MSEAELLINAMMKGDWTVEQVKEFLLAQGLVEAPEGLENGKPFSMTPKGTDVFSCLMGMSAISNPRATRRLLRAIADDDGVWERLDDD